MGTKVDLELGDKVGFLDGFDVPLTFAKAVKTDRKLV